MELFDLNQLLSNETRVANDSKGFDLSDLLPLSRKINSLNIPNIVLTDYFPYFDP